MSLLFVWFDSTLRILRVRMIDIENSWDLRFKVQTTGNDDKNADYYHFPYEPTPYSVLERLADSGLICAGDTLIDYGCGKGRVDFFLSFRTDAETVGIEYDDRIYQCAVDNRKTAVSGEKTQFIYGRAEEYTVPECVNRCYFFNPFSVEILKKVMARIIDSYYEHPREILLMFYYPSAEYLSYLMTVDEIEYYDEISCADLFDGKNKRETILIFKIVELFCNDRNNQI